MITIGVDFSKRFSCYHVLDENGRKFYKGKVENQPELIDDFFKMLPEKEPKRLAMEACRNWGLYYETVKPYVTEFHLGHPKKMCAISQSDTKNDANDAELIAKMLHSGFLPEAHVSDVETRRLRSVLRSRSYLVRIRTSLRNQIHILVDRNLWPCDKPTTFKDLFTMRGLGWLHSLSLPSQERFLLDQLLQTHQQINCQIKDLERFIQVQAGALQGLQYLRTVPGFKRSLVNLYAVLLESDGLSRFKKARHFAHYAGLIPREYSSGDKHRTGRLVKNANLFLRNAIIESTWGALRVDKGLKDYFDTVKARRNGGSAIIATARKLCYAIYHVLKEQRAYRPEAFTPVAACLSCATSS